jgi:F-type H+-transporting ATPase subunit alpha
MSDDFERLAEDWLDGARARLDRAELGAKVESIGRVEEVEDGVALVSGLPDVGLNELVRFDGGQFGFAQTLERDRVGCVLLDEGEAVEAGDAVRGTGDVVRVPVVDALFALGRGQRELIIGDRAIGKTTLAVDAIIAQNTSSVRRAIDAILAHGDPSRCIFVVAEAASPPGLQWIAPFAGFTMAEYFRDRGRHALIVVDDLSKHAATHREIALLTRQSPGREAYPGDVFYLHARMLERAAKLSAARGGGSLTALPIAETDAGNLTAYIPTNLISIADGQIVLDARLFNEGR